MCHLVFKLSAAGRWSLCWVIPISIPPMIRGFPDDSVAKLEIKRLLTLWFDFSICLEDHTMFYNNVCYSMRYHVQSASGNTSLQCWHCVIEYNICASHNHVHHNQVGFTICHNLHLAFSQQRECEGMHNRGGNDTLKGNDFHENTLHPFIKLLMSTKHN